MGLTNKEWIGTAVQAFGILGGFAVSLVGIGIGDRAARYVVPPSEHDPPWLAKLSPAERKRQESRFAYAGVTICLAGPLVALGAVVVGARMKRKYSDLR